MLPDPSELTSWSMFDWVTTGETCGGEVPLPSEPSNIGYSGLSLLTYVDLLETTPDWPVLTVV